MATPKLVTGTPYCWASLKRESMFLRLIMQPPQWRMSLYSRIFSGNPGPEKTSNATGPPTNFSSSFGSFCRAMSPSSAWWVQASMMRTLSPGRSVRMALAPSRKVAMSPLFSDMRMEKEVSGISGGSISFTSRKIWESTITSCGSSRRTASIGWTPSGVTEMTRQCRSKSSRVICTCGRMSRPFGAWMSCGMTSMTSPRSSTRWAERKGISKSRPAFSMRNFLNRPISSGLRASSAMVGIEKGRAGASSPSKRLRTQTVRTFSASSMAR